MKRWTPKALAPEAKLRLIGIPVLLWSLIPVSHLCGVRMMYVLLVEQIQVAQGAFRYRVVGVSESFKDGLFAFGVDTIGTGD